MQKNIPICPFYSSLFPTLSLSFFLSLSLSIYIYIYKVKLVTVDKGNSKACFSLAATSRCRGGRYSFPWIALLYP